MTALEDRLGHRFNDPALLRRALTHASADARVSNERLEFLGDRVLGLMIAEILMEALPEATEGELSRRFHTLVSREACAAVAHTLDLGPALRLAAGETKSGGRSNPTILGDAVEDSEAIIAEISGVKRLGRLPIVDPLTPEKLAAAFSANFDLADFQ